MWLGVQVNGRDLDGAIVQLVLESGRDAIAAIEDTGKQSSESMYLMHGSTPDGYPLI